MKPPATRKSFLPGQRWLSEAEPELGLGTVLAVTPHQVTVVFRRTGTTRQYSIEHAPLKRILFREGDSVRGGPQEQESKVTRVEEENGLMVYWMGETRLPETLLSDEISFNTPKERLLTGHVSPSTVFDLRHRALLLQHEALRSPVRGFAGGRISLIPHQLYIASEVAARHHPRVLLSDEVGLGKTIESGLILHRLLRVGRVERVLILVPEPLVHQWFVELLRRFNLWFALFDEERCQAIEQPDPSANPFAQDQLILTSLALLRQQPDEPEAPRRAEQAVAAGWDLIIVDEAHHLRWSEESPSEDYQIVAALAARTQSILLLTATPEQLGEQGHFARLRLLDPERFHRFEEYRAEQARYEQVAAFAGELLAGTPLSPEAIGLLAGTLAIDPSALAATLRTSSGQREILARLLDQHGTGRVMFRNTRAALAQFPKRVGHLIPIAAPPERLEDWRDEFETDADPQAPKPGYDFDDDPRLVWLADFLRENPAAKVLLLCRFREKAEAIEGALRGRINVKTALFHEQLPLIQRDRNAAWFAEEEGARLLICSEIGSEGRNFQFAHHLVLFDLPLDPDLLEQRIGRLDRIGQTEDIHLHVPFASGSPQEFLARWYQEGMDAFEHHFSGGAEMGERFRSEIFHLALEGDPQHGFADLLARTRACRSELEQRLHLGRDRLLELHSFRAEAAGSLVEQIQVADRDVRLERFVGDAFDHFGLRFEDLGHRAFNLGGGDLFHERIPALPQEGLTATADRARALARDHTAFLTWDHPIVTSLLDMLLSSEQGNSAFALWPHAPEAGVLIETIYLLETQAPARLHLDRFLPPTPLRIVLNHKRKELGPEAAPEVLATALKNGDPAVLGAQLEEFGNLLPGMVRVTEIIAGKQSKPLLEAALVKARETLGGEIIRLEQLRRVNPSVRLDEISAAQRELAEVETALQTAQPRLDALRLIIASSKR